MSSITALVLPALLVKVPSTNDGPKSLEGNAVLCSQCINGTGFVVAVSRNLQTSRGWSTQRQRHRETVSSRTAAHEAATSDAPRSAISMRLNGDQST